MSKCPYCHVPSAVLADTSHGYNEGLTVSLFASGTPHIGCVGYYDCGCACDKAEVPVNYCPICGRYLREVDE